MSGSLILATITSHTHKAFAESGIAVRHAPPARGLHEPGGEVSGTPAA